MQASSLAKVIKVSSLLEQQQLRLNQAQQIPSLSSFLRNERNQAFPGESDKITDVLEKRKNLLLEKHAILGDTLFILHHAIRTFLESDLTDEERTEIIKSLEDSKFMIEQRFEVLKKLESVYASLMIEPGIVAIPDGEKEDPLSFRVVVDPQPNLSPQEGAELLTSWQQQLRALETTMDTTLQLKKLPDYALPAAST